MRAWFRWRRRRHRCTRSWSVRHRPQHRAHGSEQSSWLCDATADANATTIERGSFDRTRGRDRRARVGEHLAGGDDAPQRMSATTVAEQLCVVTADLDRPGEVDTHRHQLGNAAGDVHLTFAGREPIAEAVELVVRLD